MPRTFSRRFLILSIIITNSLAALLVSFTLKHHGITVHNIAAADEGANLLLYTPLVNKPISSVPISPPISLTSTNPISVVLLLGEAASLKQELALNKIGFHTGIDGNIDGLDEWMASLDAAGIPIFLKSADNAEPLYKAQLLAKASGVPHTLVFRRSTGKYSDVDYNVPNYNLTPTIAAKAHWQLHRNEFPPELDPSLVWIETVNEVDNKGRSEWLAEFALETAKLAMADGFKWAAFGWSSGTPEPWEWEGPAMLEFLRFAGNYPNQVAIALHEYSYLVDDIGDGYPFKLGRFQELFAICDQNGINRPTVLITEWGWEYENVPDPAVALTDIQWASWLYAGYPQVKGAAIWYLGGNFGTIADQTQKLIAPVQEYSLMNYFHRPPGIGLVDPSLYHPSHFLPGYRPADHPHP
jgi:hypothetical protein